MALPATVLVRLRALCNLGNSLDPGRRIGLHCSNGARWYKTKARPTHDTGSSATEERRRDHPDILKEFPEPKNLLHTTLSRSLGLSDLSQFLQYHCTDNGDVKKATVTLTWPSKIEVEGFASRKIDAERFAAAAACHKLRELGVLGPRNQMPKRGVGRGRGAQISALEDPEESIWSDDVHEPRRDSQNESLGPQRHPRPTTTQWR